MQLSAPGIWLHAIAAAAWFGLLWHLGGRVIRARRGWLAIGAIVASLLVALSAVACALHDDPRAWALHRILDAARILAWIALLGALAGTSARGRHDPARLTRRVGPLLAAIGAALMPLPSPFAVPDPTPLTQGGGALWIALAVTGLAQVERVYRMSERDDRWSLKPLLIALGAGFFYDLFLFSDALLNGRPDAELWAARGAVSAVMVPLVGIAAARSDAWQARAGISQHVMYRSSALLASGIYLLAMAGAGFLVRASGGRWGTVLQITLLAIGLVVFASLVLSDRVRALLRVWIAKHFFPSRFDHREEWMRVSRRLAETDPVTLRREVVPLLAATVDSVGGGLWLRDESGAYREVERWNAPPVGEPELAEGALAHFLAERGWIVDIDTWRAEPATYAGMPIPRWMAGLPGAWLIVPLIASRELFGFVVLLSPRVPLPMDWETRDLLKAAAQQIAGHLAHAAAAERLLESAKFESFSRMSAFVVHDIKNLAAQLSLLTRNAERHIRNPAFQQDLLETVAHVTARLSRLLAQLRSGTTPVENPGPVDIAEVVRSVIAQEVAAAPPVVAEGPPALMVMGHSDRLRRVLRNLIANAQEATRNGATVRVRAQRSGDSVVLEVIDQGVGMNAEFIRERLFRPFETTKAGGMGIGVYESHRYLNEIGGRMEVDSRPGGGTTMRLVFPTPDRAVGTTEPYNVREAA